MFAFNPLRKFGLVIRTESRASLYRCITNLSHRQYPPGFSFWPSYFSVEEQQTLLAASLYKLDGSENRQARRKRNEYWKFSGHVSAPMTGSLTSMFAPDELYQFEEGHYDGVIHHFREMHLSAWPVEEFGGLKPILDRLYSLCPTTAVQTHLLHLASYGEILPHVDNISASGSWILGVSLGAERVLRMKSAGRNNGGFCLKLPSGSVYIQRDNVRFNYEHSIETHGTEGQRLSIMIRDQIANSSPIL